MFDFRYHVASLAAVFVALVIGILVGVGLSGRGFVDDAERSNLERQIQDLRDERDSATVLLEAAQRSGLAFDEYADDTYPALVARACAMPTWGWSSSARSTRASPTPSAGRCETAAGA